MPEELTIDQFRATAQVAETTYYDGGTIDVPPFGEFELSIELDVPLAESHVAQLQELVRAVQADRDQLFESVYQDYLRAAEDEEWMGLCEMPTHLGRGELAPWLSARRLFVRWALRPSAAGHRHRDQPRVRA